MEKQMKKISNFGILSSIFMFMSSCYAFSMIYNSLAILYFIISAIIMLVSISLRG